ncbi:MAG: hypothetical protein Faunusvirus14_16, partial [Faunusvirus sp.]
LTQINSIANDLWTSDADMDKQYALFKKGDTTGLYNYCNKLIGVMDGTHMKIKRLTVNYKSTQDENDIMIDLYNKLKSSILGISDTTAKRKRDDDDDDASAKCAKTN